MGWGAVVDAARASVDGGVPSCQVAVARDGELELFERVGGCTTATRFPIYSATKPLVAAAVWQLIGEGLLDVSQPVAAYVPDFGTNGKEAVTVEQMLLHTCGFPLAPMRPEEGADRERRLERFRRWRLDWEPGSRFEYHPASAHWVLAELLEVLRGADFRDVVEQRVTGPLGLPRMLGIPVDDQGDVAEPVLRPGGEDWVIGPLASAEAKAAGVPGGGGIATAASLALLHQALLHDRQGLWDRGVLEDARTNVRCNLPDPLLGVPVMRTLGLVLAGDDGMHQLRYAGFGKAVSPAAFGHMGAHFQLAWTDPATGASFAYVNSLVADNVVHAGLAFPVADAASMLEVRPAR